MPHSNRPVRVAIGVVIRDGHFLIARRPPGVPLAGLWEFPGGKIEPGETPEAAVARELLEETGLTVEIIRSFTERTYVYAHARVTLLPFLCRAPAGDARPLHCAEVRWVTPADLLAYPFPAANAPLLAELSQPGLQTLPASANLSRPESGD